VSLGLILSLTACGGSAPAAAPASQAASPAASTAPAKPSAASAKASAAASAPPSQAAPAKLPQVAVALTDVNFGNAFLPVAQDLGIFAKYGVEAVVKPVSSDTARFAALQSNEVQIVTGGTSTVTGVLRGVNVVTIANSADHMLYYFVGAPGIKSAADLKGKVVSGGNFNGVTDYCGRESLRQLGLAMSDVQYTQVQSTSTTVGASIIDNKIQAGCINIDTYLAIKDQGLTVLYDLTRSPIRFPWANLVASKSWTQSRPNEVKGFLKGLTEGIHWFKTHPDEAKQRMGKALKMDDQKLVATIYDNTIQYLLDDPTPTAEAQQSAIDLVAGADPKARSLKAAELIDTSFMAQIKAEGLFRDLGIEAQS
jgi:ABC-type nitrate/sulfonate/bicarbonate transport system substrate-binding protein